MRRSPIRLLATSLATITVAACAPPGSDTSLACSAAERVSALPRQLREASGLAYSRVVPGLLWSHNDSDEEPRLFAFTADGSRLGQVRVTAERGQHQWEDIASGPCPAGNCLYIADIGDNNAQRPRRWIIRFPEPDPAARTVDSVERFHFSYPDGAEDAEALFVMPDTTVYVVTKGRQGPVTLYRIRLTPGVEQAASVERVQQLTDGLVQVPAMVTGASASRDGRFVAIRTYSSVQLYRFTRAGRLRPVSGPEGYSLSALGEPQGEAVALMEDGTIYLATEAGPFEQVPFLSRLTCTLP